MQVQIASARLPQIGAVKREADGSFSVGPIPGIGGPFDTAASFIQALAAVMKHRLDDDQVRQHCPPWILNEILKGHKEFPSRLGKLAASGKHFTREGPFPIRHPDLTQCNIIVSKTLDVLGVIDWDRAYAMPWELIDFPSIFWTTTSHLISPELNPGQPANPGEAKGIADMMLYVSMLRDAEREAHTDHRLSDVLGDTEAHELGGIIHSFRSGKIGTYGRAMDYYENKYQ